MASRPLVSVVTPVHNDAKYIRECIESGLRQTYEHFEYVVMENRSTDGTLEIVQESAERDPRIRVFAADELVGPDPNAHRAVRQIDRASRYIKIVHADDWLYPECLERMVELAEKRPTGLRCFATSASTKFRPEQPDIVPFANEIRPCGNGIPHPPIELDIPPPR